MCSTTGALEYGRVPGLDVFPSEAAALAHLSSRGSRKHTTRGCAVLGCGVFGDVALVLLARKVRTAVVLPNGHEVLTVVDAKWHRAPLRDPRATLTREERAAVQSLTEIPMENLYFYCRRSTPPDPSRTPRTRPTTPTASGSGTPPSPRP